MRFNEFKERLRKAAEREEQQEPKVDTYRVNPDGTCTLDITPLYKLFGFLKRFSSAFRAWVYKTAHTPIKDINNNIYDSVWGFIESCYREAVENAKSAGVAGSSYKKEAEQAKENAKKSCNGDLRFLGQVCLEVVKEAGDLILKLSLAALAAAVKVVCLIVNGVWTLIDIVVNGVSRVIKK